MTHYHNYKVISETQSGVREKCIECRKVLVTKKDKHGRIDNKTYLKEHIRDTSQPTGRTAKIFKQYYEK